MGKIPPEEVPPNLLDRYTLNGSVKVEKWYFNEVGLSCMPKFYTRKRVEFFLEAIRDRKSLGYQETNQWLYQALDKYSIKDKTCVVIGSTSPFYESVGLYFGAKEVTAIEYNKLISFHPKIKTLRPFEYDRNPVKFDVGFSISSFEHDGLGRYGDPLNPEADLQAMKKMKEIIKKGEILFLSVPIGIDMVVWNAHRVYGKIRLPMLLKDWEILDTFGFDTAKLDVDNKQSKYQPVFILKNT
jgi:hypothetical protein